MPLTCCINASSHKSLCIISNRVLFPDYGSKGNKLRSWTFYLRKLEHVNAAQSPVDCRRLLSQLLVLFVAGITQKNRDNPSGPAISVQRQIHHVKVKKWVKITRFGLLGDISFILIDLMLWILTFGCGSMDCGDLYPKLLANENN